MRLPSEMAQECESAPPGSRPSRLALGPHSEPQWRRVLVRARPASWRGSRAGPGGGTRLGAALMAAILLTTAFTQQFRMTLVYGFAFLAVLTSTYLVYYKNKNKERG